MKIAVTAASGRLGTATLEHLTHRVPRDNVVAIARNPSRVLVKDIELRAGDYQSSEQMQTALAGIDTVIMISAPVAGGGDRLAMHRDVINAAKRAGVRKLIYTSVIGNELAEGTYFEPFYRVNSDTERLLMESGLEWVVARNGLYLDLDVMHIKHAHEHGGVYRNNAGAGRCGYISIDELGFALARLAVSDQCDGMTVNLFGELHTQAELVELASKAFDLNVRYEAISLEANIARFMEDERIAARGEDVAKMLSGCFQCMEKGAYEVTSQFERAAGRPARPLAEQLAKLV